MNIYLKQMIVLASVLLLSSSYPFADVEGVKKDLTATEAHPNASGKAYIGDGKIDIKDADVLYRLFDAMAGEPWYRHFIGGLASYKANDYHGPFVHVDERGYRARW